MGKDSIRLVANNKKAWHDYFIEDKYEAGIELHGTEVKSIRMGHCSIKEAFIRVEQGEVFIYGMHVSPYEKGIFSIKTPFACENSCSTAARSANWWGRWRRKDIRSSRSRSISKAAISRWRSRSPKERNCMTSVRILRKRISAGRRNVILKLEICNLF